MIGAICGRAGGHNLCLFLGFVKQSPRPVPPGRGVPFAPPLAIDGAAGQDLGSVTATPPLRPADVLRVSGTHSITPA